MPLISRSRSRSLSRSSLAHPVCRCRCHVAAAIHRHSQTNTAGRCDRATRSAASLSLDEACMGQGVDHLFLLKQEPAVTKGNEGGI